MEPFDLNQRFALIEQYFIKGYTYKEILGCLLGLHDVSLSMRQLNRDLKRMNLLRRTNKVPRELITELIYQELLGGSCNIGYRSMQSKLLFIHHTYASRETVRKIMKLIDPEGVSARSRNKLKRRMYLNKGPNYTWHIDGYDKLKPYGFCIHGCIDGFSRKLLWLKVGSSNNNPAVILNYYLDCVKELKGVPRRIRSDNGTENTRVAATHRVFREDDNDSFAGEKSFMFGKSTSNQRIEAWWSKLRSYTSKFWMDFFKDMIDEGILDTSNPIAQECLRFCFNRMIQHELNTVKEIHNNHRIRRYRSQECPPGRPNILFDFPEINGTQDYKCPIDENEIEIAREIETNLHPFGCSEDFFQLANILLENEIPNPNEPQEGYRLYAHLMEMITDFENDLAR